MSKAEDLLDLAYSMQASFLGKSIVDIQNQFGVSRRTAERMRDQVLRTFPQAEEVYTGERTKRWRIPYGTSRQLLNFSAEELAALENAVSVFERDNMLDQANLLSGLQDKIKSILKPQSARRIEPDLDALLESEGLAMRAGPKPKLNSEVVDGLRNAILACNVVEIDYANTQTNKVNKRRVQPYGFLMGNRHYLVAFHMSPKVRDFVLFSLPSIRTVRDTGEMFERDEDFSLEDYAERSFGVFQEEPFDVVWKFKEEAAHRAKEFQFHPSQEMEEQKDGSLLVRFCAGSDIEMAWHLFAWGDNVEVLEPKKLADMMKKHHPHWDAIP